MEVNEIRITPDFYLAKEIIHIYVSRYFEEKEPIKKIKESYIQLFDVIKREKYRSIIIPSLGTGFHFYLHEEIAEMVVNLLKNFCNKNDVEIILDLLGKKTKELYQKYL